MKTSSLIGQGPRELVSNLLSLCLTRFKTRWDKQMHVPPRMTHLQLSTDSTGAYKFQWSVRTVPEARLWNDNSHFCLFHTVHLDGVIQCIVQTVLWLWLVWTCWRDRRPKCTHTIHTGCCSSQSQSEVGEVSKTDGKLDLFMNCLFFRTSSVFGAHFRTGCLNALSRFYFFCYEQFQL